MVTCNGSVVQAGESEKQKSYTAICQLSTVVTPDMVHTINSTKDLELHQQTPVRVSHRRADLVRHRTVYAMTCDLVPGSPRHLILHLRTQVSCLTSATKPCIPSTFKVMSKFECYWLLVTATHWPVLDGVATLQSSFKG